MQIETSRSVRKTVSLRGRGAWLLVSAILGGMAVASAALLVWIHHLQMESRPLLDGLAAMLGFPAAVAILGTPVSPGYLGSVTVSSVDHQLRVELSISVHGPKAAGSLQLDGREKDGQWTYAVMLLTANGEQLNLLAAPSGQ
jgi:hypothetical protein